MVGLHDAINATKTGPDARCHSLEVQQSTFGFDRQGALGNTVFLEFNITNKGGNSIDSLYINLWSDPDLGGAGDDLVGCDTTLSLGYVYNATNTDQQYADRPPAVGYDFFQARASAGRSFRSRVHLHIMAPTAFAYRAQLHKGLQRDGSRSPTRAKSHTCMVRVTRSRTLLTQPDHVASCDLGPFSWRRARPTLVGAITSRGRRSASSTPSQFFDVKAQTRSLTSPAAAPPPARSYSSHIV